MSLDISYRPKKAIVITTAGMNTAHPKISTIANGTSGGEEDGEGRIGVGEGRYEIRCVIYTQLLRSGEGTVKQKHEVRSTKMWVY